MAKPKRRYNSRSSDKALLRERLMSIVAVPRRARFEGNSWEVVESPTMRILGQGFDSEEMAQIRADEINRETKGQARK